MQKIETVLSEIKYKGMFFSNAPIESGENAFSITVSSKDVHYVLIVSQDNSKSRFIGKHTVTGKNCGSLLEVLKTLDHEKK